MPFSNPLAIASVSLGQHPTHTLDQKIIACARNGFSGIEIVWADLEAYSSSNKISMTAGAAAIKVLCKSHKLAILSLNPMKNFENHHSPLADRLEVANMWIDMCHVLGAKYLQVPSQFDTDNSTEDEVKAVDDLRKLADLAAEKGISIAYEAVAWGSYIDTWQQSRDIVRKVERENFGVCLDAFHVIAKLWGDNTTPSGKLVGGDEALEISLAELVKKEEWPVEKLFYVQLSDGELYDPPLAPGNRFYDPSMNPRLTWSRNTRPFPGETEFGACFPIVEFTRAVLVDLGFKGWISFECFDWRMRAKDVGPDVAARRGKRSWDYLTRAIDSKA
jgi:sugar phosphate isomerase/epimerase